MQIKLSSKRKIRLTALNQRYTYDGVLLGAPSASRNKSLVKNLRTYAREQLNTDKVHLIKPQTQYVTRSFLGNIHFIKNLQKHAQECATDTPEQLRGETLERLPLVICMATFISKPLKKSEDDDGSSLSVMWFQDALAMPIDKAVVQDLKALDWEKLATAYWH